MNTVTTVRLGQEKAALTSLELRHRVGDWAALWQQWDAETAQRGVETPGRHGEVETGEIRGEVGLVRDREMERRWDIET